MTVGISIKAAHGIRLSDVWLTVNAYPSGFGRGHPIGKFRLLTHRPGSVRAGQEITTSWTAARLFDTDALDLTLDFAAGDDSLGGPIAHLTVTR